jgi:hypothetical protein
MRAAKDHRPVNAHVTCWCPVRSFSTRANAVGEGPLSNELSATPSAASVFLSDQFERTLATGFGTADLGGPWSVSASTSAKVANGEGVVYGWTGGGQDVQAWTATSAADMELLATALSWWTSPRSSVDRAAAS